MTSPHLHQKACWNRKHPGSRWESNPGPLALATMYMIPLECMSSLMQEGREDYGDKLKFTTTRHSDCLEIKNKRNCIRDWLDSPLEGTASVYMYTVVQYGEHLQWACNHYLLSTTLLTAKYAIASWSFWKLVNFWVPICCNSQLACKPAIIACVICFFPLSPPSFSMLHSH